MNVIDLFSGAGGLSLGFKESGYNIVLANEIDSEIANTYIQNNPETLMINEDIRKFIDNFNEIIDCQTKDWDKNKINKLQSDLSNIDVVIGGPPCQGFSMAGGRIRKANEFIEDPRNFLFKYYFKIIQKFEPKYFVFENVEGILSSKNGEIINTIKNIFNDESNFTNGKYYLNIKVFDAASYGIPQARKRVIILGSKIEFKLDELISQTLESLTPQEKLFYTTKKTVYDAIHDLEKIDCYSHNNIPNHIGTKHNKVALARIQQVKQDENWQSLNETIKSVHSGAYGRLSWNKPATTITTRFDTPSAGRYIHPTLDRTITPREAARIQTFPDNYIFYGSKTSICKQIGNAVPPKLAGLIAKMIIKLENR